MVHIVGFIFAQKGHPHDIIFKSTITKSNRTHMVVRLVLFVNIVIVEYEHTILQYNQCILQVKSV